MHNLSKTHTLESSASTTSMRVKARSFMQICRKARSDEFTNLREFNVEVSPTFQKKITLESLLAYVRQLIGQVYEADALGMGRVFGQFISKDLAKLRQRIQERLSLLMYLADSLKFKPYVEVERQILKQWRKNVIFFSINTIWMTRMRVHKFISVQEFTEQYRKHVALVANLTHYYFKDALLILDGKNVATFTYLQQDTAHKIINSMHEWDLLYKQIFIPLIKRRNSSRHFNMHMNFSPKTLNINQQYLDTESGKGQLVETIRMIGQLAKETTIHCKIELLKEIRSTFIKQIQQNRQQIALNYNLQKFSPLQKDDIIGCMIYCIIQGQITDIQTSIQALYELLGPKNQLLSRRGVDSYRADLESAVEYLCQQSEMNGKETPKLLQLEQIKVELANKSTHLQLFDSS